MAEERCKTLSRDEWISAATKINKEETEAGFMLSNGQSGRDDYSRFLGEPLTKTEELIYQAIAEESRPITAKQIYYKATGLTDEGGQNLVWTNICRIKQKLGKLSIITVANGQGYISIGSLVSQNNVLNMEKITAQLDRFT